MQGYNVIIIFNNNKDKILLCERKKDPYQGLSNFVGGKIEKNEDSLTAVYRELFEETAITKADIKLVHLMDFTYHLDNIYVEVWVGNLIKDFEVKGEENKLFWSTLEHNFFDLNLYAGEGNIGHMLEHVKMNKDKIFK
ncbi:MAG: NUDIX hydrolase [Bacilli bacterium]|nr:NUDIX hydrolase [Bacilli bacterium]